MISSHFLWAYKSLAVGHRNVLFCFTMPDSRPGFFCVYCVLCVRSKLFPGYNISRKCKTVELLDAMYLQRSGSLTENANKYLKTEHLMTPTAVFCNPLISRFYASHLFGMRRKTVEEARLLNLIVTIISPSLSPNTQKHSDPNF